RYIAVVYWDGAVRFWGVENGKLIDEFIAHEDAQIGGMMLADGEHLATADQTGNLHCWKLAEIGVDRYVNRHNGEVYQLAYTPENLKLLSVGHDGQMKVWDRNTLQETGYLAANEAVTAVTVSPDGRFWCSGTAGGVVRLWDVEQQRFDASIDAHKHLVSCLRFLPTVDRFVTASWDMKLRLWSSETQQLLTTFDGHNKEVAACDVSLDARRLASASWDCDVRIWDLLSVDREFGKCLLTLSGHRERVLCCAFSPDGTRLATGGADKTVMIWNAEKIAEPSQLLGHAEQVTGVCFTPDGNLLLSVDRGGAVMAWDGTSCKLLATTAVDGSLMSLAVSPDGRQAAVGDQNGNVRFLILEYGFGPNWVAASAYLKNPSVWTLGAPPSEVYEINCLYCGTVETIRAKQLGKAWKCPKCGGTLMICPKSLPLG
ncbi:MAG: WD40 repeat domain-containing protein, partial [Planctomycetia bacterium]